MFFNHCAVVRGIAHWPVNALTNAPSSFQPPPIFCVKSVQAETIIAVVEICLLGLARI